MRTLCVLFFFAIISGISQKAFADSPLTSTDFYQSYLEVEMVAYAKEKGILDKKIADFLMKEGVPTDQKAAVVNALGWRMEGKNNAVLFQKFLNKKYGKKAANNKGAKYSGDELMCLGYMQALDDYFNPSKGLECVELALRKLPKSYTANIIQALVKAQIVLDTDWCQVWRVVEKVEMDISLTPDMKADARKTIVDYVQLYEGDCGE